MTSKFYGWPENNRTPILWPSVNSNWSYSPETPLGQNWRAKQQDTSPMPHQALCIIQLPYANANWSYSSETVKLGIRWWKHSEKGQADGKTDRPADRRTDCTFHRAAWSRLQKKIGHVIRLPLPVSPKLMRRPSTPGWNLRVLDPIVVISASQPQRPAHFPPAIPHKHTIYCHHHCRWHQLDTLKQRLNYDLYLICHITGYVP